MIELALVPLQAADEVPMPSTEMLLIQLGILVILGVGTGYWVYRNASERENNEVRWAIGTGVLMFLFPPVGVIALVAYLIFRGDVTDTEPSSDVTAGDDWESTDETTSDDW